MTITCPRGGEIWGTQAMSDALTEVKALGVDWVSIHPYARVSSDGSLRFVPAAETGFLAKAATLTREAGMRLFWKPHMAYFGSFEWAGAIEFGNDEAAWNRFFMGYRAFIVDQARFADSVGVPIFAVGVELEGTAHREAEWREILRAVREVYRGRITYAANWDRLELVPFWDAVDAIGVQAYFPLSFSSEPSIDELIQGWQEPLSRLGAFSRRHGDKSVIFAEIGYNRAPTAAREPWTYLVVDSPETRALRQRLIEAALTRLEREPFIEGIFWWKWMPGASAGRSNFSMRDPEAVEMLRRFWAGRPSTQAR